ncbi:MAG: winged helix-turn-helix transcriptional regulator [Gammaproteobacteria bacterium]|nr:winged helix-turn-helix transcriptional regulator [Gammaproteobacteria bacterium]
MAYQEIFAALADPTRRQLFESLLGNAKTVGEIAVDETVSRPAVSQQSAGIRNRGACAGRDRTQSQFREVTPTKSHFYS